jgi:hypothetical protein
VTLVVSRGTMPVGGVKACFRCGRPRDRKGQRYCRLCHTLYMREYRAGKVMVLLTVDEWEAVKLVRVRAARTARRAALAAPLDNNDDHAYPARAVSRA